MRKKMTTCLIVLSLLLSGTLVAFANDYTSDIADYQNFDYVFYSYEEFREAFPLIPDRHTDNHYYCADELLLTPSSIVIQAMLPCGEIVDMTIYLDDIASDVRKFDCCDNYEMWFDSYEEFRAAFPLIDGIHSVDRMSSCGGSYRIGASNTGRCVHGSPIMVQCAHCRNFAVPLYTCVGKVYSIRRDCTVCGTRTWEEVRGSGCGRGGVGPCTRGCR